MSVFLINQSLRSVNSFFIGEIFEVSSVIFSTRGLIINCHTAVLSSISWRPIIPKFIEFVAYTNEPPPPLGQPPH